MPHWRFMAQCLSWWWSPMVLFPCGLCVVCRCPPLVGLFHSLQNILQTKGKKSKSSASGQKPTVSRPLPLPAMCYLIGQVKSNTRTLRSSQDRISRLSQEQVDLKEWLTQVQVWKPSTLYESLFCTLQQFVVLYMQKQNITQTLFEKLSAEIKTIQKSSCV